MILYILNTVLLTEAFTAIPTLITGEYLTVRNDGNKGTGQNFTNIVQLYLG